MNPGDIIQTFGNPVKLEYPIGQAKLIEKKKTFTSFEWWVVEYLDEPDHQYTILIKKI
jgi:hypothetical protein